jgi:hypothetical protein
MKVRGGVAMHSTSLRVCSALLQFESSDDMNANLGVRYSLIISLRLHVFRYWRAKSLLVLLAFLATRVIVVVILHRSLPTRKLIHRHGTRAHVQ